MSWTSQPVCAKCWDDEHPYRHPVRVTGSAVQPETCCYCGTLNRSGIYVRVDTDAVPYPTVELEATHAE